MRQSGEEVRKAEKLAFGYGRILPEMSFAIIRGQKLTVSDANGIVIVNLKAGVKHSFFFKEYFYIVDVSFMLYYGEKGKMVYDFSIRLCFNGARWK